MDSTPQPQDELSYFQQRMQLLGITDALNTIDIRQGGSIDKAGNHTGYEVKPMPIFTQTDKGIDILVYTLHRLRSFYRKGDSKTALPYTITRLEKPYTKKDGSIQKYNMPKGEPLRPFFPPCVVAAYEAAKDARAAGKPQQTIKVLVLTEGYFKAFKAGMHGIMCIGLPSITAMKSSETGRMHDEVLQVIETCGVERIIWLTDGDCLNITSKEIIDGKDLYQRPKNFFNSVHQFHNLLSEEKYSNIHKYFAHIHSDNITNNPKGLDDLLVALPEEADKIVEELHRFDRIGKGGQFTGNYFVRLDVTFGTGNVHKYFMLHDVDVFYQHHVARRPELARAEFVFNGTRYKFNDSDKVQRCEIVIPGDAQQYFRVGDDYYQYVEVPDKHGKLVRSFHGRQKGTILDDHGRKFTAHIPKYKAFCITPDHTNYQRVIHNCFNMYHPFAHEAEQGEYDASLNFVKHIFGTNEVSFKDNSGQPVTMPYYELGLDYLQLLYQRPQQTLPILCLVSKENQTGKTTFINWLNMIFGENMIIIGNQDLQNDFNAHWTSKLLVAVDETKIDKQIVQEKLKSLSTANKVSMNAKGKNQVQMDFFAKFILNSNNEDNFIMVGEHDIRYWVIKVPTIRQKNFHLVDELIEEIPAFLHYLNKRTLKTPERSRMHFDESLLKTEALMKLVKNSKSGMEKNIRLCLAELFDATDDEEITMPLSAVCEMVKKPLERNFVQKTLNEMGITTNGPHHKHYPRMVFRNSTDSNTLVADVEFIKFNNRYYTFYRKDFTDTPTKAAAAMQDAPPPPLPPQGDFFNTNAKDDLPF